MLHHHRHSINVQFLFLTAWNVFLLIIADNSRKYESKMLSEVAGNKMISFVTSFTGGATPALSETSSSNRHMEASSVPINKSISRSDKCSDMPPPRNPTDSTVATPNPTHPAAKLKVQELNEFFLCFLCAGYKVEATTINECMHSCEYHSPSPPPPPLHHLPIVSIEY